MSLTTQPVELRLITDALQDTDRPRPSVSIIIPALNEYAHIEECLRSLVTFSTSSVSFEVIVVDNGSTDQTLEVVKSYEHKLNLTVYCVVGVPIGALRNFGVERSRSPFVAFLDADCVAPPGWLEHLVAHAGRIGETGVIGCRYEIPSKSSWVARSWERGQTGTTHRTVRYLPGGDMAMHRNVFLRLGGFDESLATNEDAELCKRARDLGLLVIADPALAVVHLGTSQTLNQFYRRQYWHGTHVFKVFCRTPFRSGNEKAVLFAIYMLALEVGLAISFLLFVTAGHWTPLLLVAALMSGPAILLASLRIRSTHAWADLPCLVVLYTVYGLARAHCLVRR